MDMDDIKEWPDIPKKMATTETSGDTVQQSEALSMLAAYARSMNYENFSRRASFPASVGHDRK